MSKDVLYFLIQAARSGAGFGRVKALMSDIVITVNGGFIDVQGDSAVLQAGHRSKDFHIN